MSSLSEDQAAAEAAAERSAEPDKVDVTDFNMLAQLLIRWHGRKVKSCEHMLQMPEGQVIQIGDDPEMTLSGDLHRAFTAGVNMALMEFGILPFTFELEDGANEPAAQVPTAPG